MTVDRRLVLVDYYSLFVPEMQGQPASEEGTEGYKHPKRNANQFNRHTDDFSILLISLALRLIAQEPKLYTDTQSDEHLLFTSADFTDLGKSALHERIWNKLAKVDPLNSTICKIVSGSRIVLNNPRIHCTNDLIHSGSTTATQKGQGIQLLQLW